MTPSVCPKCRTPLPPSAPRGLCPACLMDAAGAETEVVPVPEGFGGALDLDTLRRAFPQLEILAPLGAGGMGRVYKVRQPNLDRMAALKVLPPEYARDAAWVERFTREARALARLNHPNIVQVFDVGQTSSGPDAAPLCWLLMEFVDGVTLRQVQRTGGLSAREALALVPKLCDALQYAHEKGVLHRDIKPENILLDSAGAAKIADFGLAKLAGAHPAPTLTVAGARLGTAAYMAPEQIESPGDVDHRADIYSLGVVLYELLTGGLPLGRFPAPSEKSGTDPRLDHIVFRTLEKERERRYQAAGDMRTALETVAAAPQPPPLPPHGTPIAPQPRIVQTKQSLPADTPPDLPPGTLLKVRYHQRGKSGPSSGMESPSHGCGWILVVPLPLALAAAPGLIPVLWYEAIRELFPRQLEDFYPASALFVAAATGVIAWLAARPFLKLSRLAERAWVQRKAPLFLLMALVLWGAVLTLVSGASRSFPTRGAMRTLDFSCLRLPQSAGEATSPEAALESLWQQKVEEEFGRDRAAITAPDENYTRGNPNNPLCKYWRFTFVGTSGEVTEARLIRLAENMIAALPEIARGSATLSIYSSLGRRDSGTLYLRGENAFAFIGILMTLGGWFASLTRGRPIFNGAVPWLMVLIVSAAHLAPSQNLPGAVDVPAPDPPGGVALPHLALERLRELEKSEAEPETSALYRWIDACRRLDRAAAAALSKRRLEDHEWQHLVGFWQNNLPLSISRDLSPGRADRPGVPFVCVVVPAARPGASTSNNYRTYYHPFYEARDAIQSTSVTLTVTKDGDTWQVEQYP